MSTGFELSFARCAAAVGATVESRRLVLDGHHLSFAVAPNGIAEVRAAVTPATATAVVEALVNNPERGWAMVLDAGGTLVRRVRVPPTVWIDRQRLQMALREVVRGAASTERETSRDLVLRVVESFALTPALRVAGAAYLLRSDDAASDGARHVLRGESIAAVELVGGRARERRARTRREATVLRALALRPDAALALTTNLGVALLGPATPSYQVEEVRR